MCLPVLGLLQGVVGALGAVASHAQAQAQADQQNQLYEENRKAANKAAVDRYTAQQNRALQERKATSLEKQNLQREAVAARATAQAAAAESGVTGLSVDALVADFYNQEGVRERVLDNNYRIQADYLRSELDVTEAQAISRINSVPQATGPSFLATAVNIFGAGVNAFAKSRAVS